MNRILDLQALDTSMDESDAVGDSTSSYKHCTCSTASMSGCSAEPIIIAI